MDTDLTALSNEELMALYNKEKAGQASEPAGPGYAEDLTKATGAAPVIRGGVMAATGPQNIYDMSMQGAAKLPKAIGTGYQWLADKFAPESFAEKTRGAGGWTDVLSDTYDKARESIDKMRKEGVSNTYTVGNTYGPKGKTITVPPGRIGPHTYANVMQRTEEGTGPLHQAETLPGKIAQGALEAAPSLMGGAPGSVVKGLGAVTGSELAGAATEGTRFEPWAKLAGGVAGSFVPSGKKAPNLLFPPTPEHQKMVDVVKPHVSGLTAGQVTGNPKLQKFEGMGGLSTEPQLAQASSHALSLGGVSTPSSQRGIADLEQVRAAGRAAGQEKSNIIGQSRLRYDQEFDDAIEKARKHAGIREELLPNPSPKPGLLKMPPEQGILPPVISKKDTKIEKLRKELDQAHNKIMFDIAPGVKGGKQGGGTRYSSMGGPHSEEIMADLKSVNKRAWKIGADRVATAAHDTESALRNAMDRSLVGTTNEGRLGKLREAYTNFKALEGVTEKQGTGAVLPMDKVYAALLKTRNPNAPNMALGKFANAAEKVGVGKPLPKYDPEHASLAKILGGLTTAGAGSYLHGIGAGGGVPAGGEFLSGYFGTPTVLNMLGRLAGKGVSSKAMQSHLPNAGTDKDMLARLLLTQGAPRVAAETAPE